MEGCDPYERIKKILTNKSVQRKFFR